LTSESIQNWLIYGSFTSRLKLSFAIFVFAQKPQSRFSEMLCVWLWLRFLSNKEHDMWLQKNLTKHVNSVQFDSNNK